MSAPDPVLEGLRRQLGQVVPLRSEAEFKAVVKLTSAHPAKTGGRQLSALVKFTASWCGPCQRIAPRFAELAKQYAADALFVSVDADELEEVVTACNVAAMPTFLLYWDGALCHALEGSDEEALARLAAKCGPGMGLQDGPKGEDEGTAPAASGSDSGRGRSQTQSR